MKATHAVLGLALISASACHVGAYPGGTEAFVTSQALVESVAQHRRTYRVATRLARRACDFSKSQARNPIWQERVISLLTRAEELDPDRTAAIVGRRCHRVAYEAPDETVDVYRRRRAPEKAKVETIDKVPMVVTYRGVKWTRVEYFRPDGSYAKGWAKKAEIAPAAEPKGAKLQRGEVAAAQP